MNNIKKAFLLFLGLSAFAAGLNQLLELVTKWIIPIIPQGILSSIPPHAISTISLIPIAYLPLIIIYTYITIRFINRERYKTEKKLTDEFNKKIEHEQELRETIESECANWFNLCGRLCRQVRKDHTELMNMVWDTNKRQPKPSFQNELDILMYEAESSLEEYKKIQNNEKS